MKKFIIASASAIAVLGLAACSDTDDTTTQSVEPTVEQPASPGATPAPVEPAPTSPSPAPSTPAPAN